MPRPEEPAALHRRVCNLCEAACGLAIEVRDGEVVSIRGDDDDPFSRGHVCPKAVALQDLESDPDRLRRPVRRVGPPESATWREIGWQEALDEVAERIRALQADHGRHSLAVYLGNPNVHNYANLLYGLPLLHALGTRNRFSATSVDQLPHHLAAHLMFGHQLLLPVPDLDRTRFLLVLGANPAVSNGSLMTAPGAKRRLKELTARGGRLVVVDPRRTETARLADRHLFIRPGTDALLLLALLQVIFDEGLERPRRLAGFTDSLPRLRDLVAAVEPERVADATGVRGEEIRRLARDLARAKSAVCYGRIGVSTQEFGGLCQWLINALNTVTGNLDRPGGALFTRPAVDWLARASRGGVGRWRSRVRGLPEVGGELPVAILAEEILTPENGGGEGPGRDPADGPGRVRGLLTVAGNPVLSTPNGRQLEGALSELELVVAIDPYVNETTRHAQIILPPAGPLTRDHYDLVFNALAVRNTARYSRPLFEPPEGSLHDWQIFAALHERLDRLDGAGWRRRATRWLRQRLGPRRLLALGLRFGPYGQGLLPFGSGLTLGRLERMPHGADLGPLEPCLPERLRTPGGRIELVPQLFVEDLVRLHRRFGAGAAGPAGPARDAPDGEPADGAERALLLIGRRQVRSNNSWMHNAERLMKGADRCTLLMHPDDAAERGLAGSARVTVVSRTGRIEVPLEESEEMMPGVVSLPHGFGHHRPGTRLSVAERTPGASLNDVTDELRVDRVSGNAALSGVPVRVEPAGEPRLGTGSETPGGSLRRQTGGPGRHR